MNRVFILATVFFIINCMPIQKKTKMNKKLVKTEEEWKKSLTPMQFHVLREAGTEKPGSSKLNDFWEEGTYLCAACKTPLYNSRDKFDAYCGWPSFDRAIEENIERDVDYKIGYARTELKCKTCGGHLGHVFNDGPTETGKRHCLNGVALMFVPKKTKK